MKKQNDIKTLTKNRERALRHAIISHDKCPSGGNTYIACTCQRCTINRAELRTIIANAEKTCPARKSKAGKL